MTATQKPLVSIVTPSFNQGRFLEETILSVLSQDYGNVDYIIIDGGSTDNTLEIIRKYEKKLAYWVSEEDRGQTDAINKGFAVAQGQILAWLNSDDTYNPGTIREVVEQFNLHPEAGLLYGDLNFIDENSHLVGRFPAAQTSLSKMLRGYVHIPQPSAFFRADLWKKVAPLDPTFYFAMDYDLWIRLAKISTIKYLPGHVWANFRFHSATKTISADERCWPEMLRVHYRDGGKWLSPIVAKYYLRKLAAPLINWKRRHSIN